jgi:hypothetical protein
LRGSGLSALVLPLSAQLAAGIIGAGAALLVVVITTISAQRLESRRQRGEMVCAAISDLFSALAESSLGDEHHAKVRYAHAKARLLTYAPAEIVQALLAFEQSGATGASPESQKAIADLAQGARKAVRGQGGVANADAIELLFGQPPAP